MICNYCGNRCRCNSSVELDALIKELDLLRLTVGELKAQKANEPKELEHKKKPPWILTEDPVPWS
jgi:hypothetical protein